MGPGFPVPCSFSSVSVFRFSDWLSGSADLQFLNDACWVARSCTAHFITACANANAYAHSGVIAGRSLLQGSPYTDSVTEEHALGPYQSAAFSAGDISSKAISSHLIAL